MGPSSNSADFPLGGASPTQADIAKRAKVSRRSVYNFLRGDVSRLSPDVRERLEKIVSESGYRTPFYIDLLRNKRPNHVGVAVGHIHNEFYTQFLHGFLAALSSRGLHGMLLTGSVAGDTPRLVAEKRFGSLFLMNGSPKGETLEAIIKHHTPFVEFEAHTPQASGRITLDHRSHMENLLSFLWERGYRRLGFFDGASGIPQNPNSRGGILWSLCQQRGMEVHPSWVLPGGDRLPVAYESVKALYQDRTRTLPDALFTHNDHTAMAVLAALSDLGVSVPGEVGVVGQDGVASGAYYRPSLTTVDFELSRLVESCADTVAKVHLEGASGLETLYTGKLVVRGSTRSPSKSLVP